MFVSINSSNTKTYFNSIQQSSLYSGRSKLVEKCVEQVSSGTEVALFTTVFKHRLISIGRLIYIMTLCNNKSRHLRIAALTLGSYNMTSRCPRLNTTIIELHSQLIKLNSFHRIKFLHRSGRIYSPLFLISYSDDDPFYEVYQCQFSFCILFFSYSLLLN